MHCSAVSRTVKHRGLREGVDVTEPQLGTHGSDSMDSRAKSQRLACIWSSRTVFSKRGVQTRSEAQSEDSKIRPSYSTGACVNIGGRSRRKNLKPMKVNIGFTLKLFRSCIETKKLTRQPLYVRVCTASVHRADQGRRYEAIPEPSVLSAFG